MKVVEDLIETLKKKQEEVSKQRDELRSFVSEVEAVCQSLDEAEDEMESALASLQCAVDSLSEYQ